ncbi:hypothetical protein [Thermobrachium celere]|uniref:hypothetical protein n=1 Tax=Thermobrachium celere TaxID=53422 RepID=UPI001943713B|nr:hypothetical protein [Thermobrachium celere]GFR36410.1 hypothetical protein TCEA9_22220 [Thermobrachium celere]
MIKHRGNVALFYIVLIFLFVIVISYTSMILLSSNKIIKSTVASEQAYNNAQAGWIYVYRNIIQKEGSNAQDRKVVLNFDNINKVEIVFKNRKYEKKFLITITGRSGAYVKSIYKEISYR